MSTFHIQTFEDYKLAYAKSVNEPEAFWEEIAQHFAWRKKWDNILEWNFEEPRIHWFKGGKLNITENCLDRHLDTQANKTALIWEPNEPGETEIRLTYRELYERVARFSNVLKNNGIEKGDRVCIYLPMIPELLIAVLACARIGAVHSVVFAGFSAQAMADRVNDAEAKMIITADGMYRGAKTMSIKPVVDKALEQCTCVNRVLIVQRSGEAIDLNPARDRLLNDELTKADAFCDAVEMDAEDPLFILYTSGSTGKPKGIVHTCGGYMVGTAYTFKNVFQYTSSWVY